MSQAGKFTVAVDIPEVAFGVRNAGFDGAKLKHRSRDVDIMITPGAEQDESIILGEATELREIPSVVFEEGKCNFTTNPEGLGTAAGDGITAADTWLSHYLSSLCGEATILDDGDTVAAAPPPTDDTFTETTAGAHAIKGFIGHVQGGKLEVRPILTYAVAAIGLAFALPVIPVALEVINGSAHGRFSEFTSLPCQIEVLGNTAAEHNEAYGVQISKLTIGEVESGKVPALAFESRAATGLHQNAGTRTVPTGQRPSVMAGGDVLLGEYATTDYDSLKFGRPNIEITRSFEAIEDPNSTLGLCGWEPLTDTTVRLTLTVPQLASLTGAIPPVAMTAPTWFDLWQQGAEEFLHAQVKFGLSAARVLVFYFPKLILLSKPEPAEVRSQSAWKLTFAPPEGTVLSDAFWWGIL